jgi:hypothetical protein
VEKISHMTEEGTGIVPMGKETPLKQPKMAGY